MGEELSVGVKILLERGKTNPDELKEEYGQWGQLREAVFAYKERKDRGPWLRGLTEQEIDALYEMFNSLYRSVFDAWVMKTVLGADEEEEKEYSTGTFKTFTETMRLDANGNLGLGSHTWSHPTNTRVGPTINNVNTIAQLDADPSPAFLQKVKKGLGL